MIRKIQRYITQKINRKISSYFFITMGLVISINAQAQVCSADIPETTPTSQFTLNDDGTAVDNKTDLIWMRCSLGQTWDGTLCRNGVDMQSWKDTLEIANNTTFAGVSDWRLPNIKELSSIVERNCYFPAINVVVFPNSPGGSRYWSSSPYVYHEGSAWFILFENGDDGAFSKTSKYQARLVRGGQ